MEAGAATEAVGRTAAGAPRRGPRKILLFSDGTGNSSGKLFKTNVWRLYEAVDLGPGRDGWPAQIALYNNGVGTSTLRPLAALGGIFGFGLKSNVLALYKYVCRNWMPGDEIFLFGFSRGAFTVRLLTGLIVSQGILRGAGPGMPPDEDRLAYLARAAYRAFSGDAWPNRWPARMVSKLVRGVRDLVLELHRRLTKRVRYHPAQNVFTDIAFVGVWDTVAAYGGPIIEITRGIDDWIWPLTMPNFELSPRVSKARHALSLDDERDAFQPLLWDEVREEMLVKWGGPIHTNGPDGLQVEVRQVSDGRLKQVWFCGMHADVGGGYSDESLSFVSLSWMIDELDGAVRLLPEYRKHIAGIANVYGPIHDSRAGMGAYYRFQPRRISALVDWRNAASEAQLALARSTRSMRDPAVADRAYRIPDRGELPPVEIEELAAHIRRDHGMLTAVRVHESVVDRIHSGTDNYAPIGLPQRFDVVFSRRGGLAPRTLDPIIAKNMRDERRRGGGDATWFTRQGRTWDMVGLRRVQYFLAALFTSLLATMPLWDNFLPAQHDWQVCTDSRCVARPILELLDKVSGGYAGPWVDAFARNFLIMLILVGLVGLMFAWSRAYDLKLRSRARRAWRRALGLEARTGTEPEQSRGIAAVRDTEWYQGLTVAFKWHLAPAVAGLGLILVAFMVTMSLLSQLALFPLDERHDVFCRESAVHAPIADEPIAFPMNIASPCNGAGRSVTAGEVYSIRITVLPNPVQAIDQPEGWSNARASGANPASGRGADLPWWRDLIGAPFKRVMLADWLAPLVAVQTPPGNDDIGQRVFGRNVEIDRLDFVCDPKSGGYVTLFQPETTGTLRMFVNDALLPWRPSHFYANNVGRAVVQVWTGADAPEAVPGALVCSVAAM